MAPTPGARLTGSESSGDHEPRRQAELSRFSSAAIGMSGCHAPLRPAPRARCHRAQVTPTQRSRPCREWGKPDQLLQRVLRVAGDRASLSPLTGRRGLRRQLGTLDGRAGRLLGLHSVLGMFLGPIATDLALGSLAVISQTLLFALVLPVSALLAAGWCARPCRGASGSACP